MLCMLCENGSKYEPVRRSLVDMIQIKKGLNIPLSGAPVQEISPSNEIRTVGVVAADYVGLRPAMEVRDGDRVRLGQTLMTDKSFPEVRFAAPGAGIVTGGQPGSQEKIDLDRD